MRPDGERPRSVIRSEDDDAETMGTMNPETTAWEVDGGGDAARRRWMTSSRRCFGMTDNRSTDPDVACLAAIAHSVRLDLAVQFDDGWAVDRALAAGVARRVGSTGERSTGEKR